MKAAGEFFNPKSGIRNPKSEEAPFAAVTLCMVAGICAAAKIEAYYFPLLAFGAAALAGGAAAALSRDRIRIARLLGLASLALAALLTSLARRDARSDRDLRSLLAANRIPLNELIQFEGCVAGDSQRRDGEILTTLDLRALRLKETWLPCEGRAGLRIPDESGQGPGPRAPALAQGDRVRGWAAWNTPRNYQNPGATDHVAFLARRGIFLLGRVKTARLLEVIPGDCQDPWSRPASAIRGRIKTSLGTLERQGNSDQSAILAAVVVGDYSGLGGGVREAFQNSGTYHVLVVSGLHVTWIAWVLLGVFKALHLPRDAGRLLAAASIFLYSQVVGFQASISRSLWMFLLYLCGQVLFRRAAPINIALVSAALLLAARPDWLFDAGFQLSFVSVLAICLMGAPAIERGLKPVLMPLMHAGDPDRLFLAPGRGHRFGRLLRTRCELWAEGLADRWRPEAERVILAAARVAGRAMLAVTGMVAVSLSVQVWLEPLLAYHFNRLSWIAPLANLVIVPLSSLVLASGLASACLSGLPMLAPLLLHWAGELASLLLAAASAISALPGAWQRCPTPSAAWVAAGILVVASWCFMGWRRRWISWVFIGAFLACLATGSIPGWGRARSLIGAQADETERGFLQGTILRVTFLDVGEGDALVLTFPDNRVWAVDAGGIRQGRNELERDHAFDVGEAVVSRYLWSRWIMFLDRLVLTHSDVDHAGGMPAVLQNFRAGSLHHGESANDPLPAPVADSARARGVPMVGIHAGRREVIAGVDVEVLNPAEAGGSRTGNEGSVVLLLRYGGLTCLLTGDLEKAAERELLERMGTRKSLLLKVAHHGSRWATSDALLERLQPRWAVISVGRNNPFGHPSPEVVQRLLRHGVRPMLTLDRGAITFITDGRRYNLWSHVSGRLESGSLP